MTWAHLWRVRSTKPRGPWIYFECPPGSPVGPHVLAKAVIRRSTREIAKAPATANVRPAGKTVYPAPGWELPLYVEAQL